MKKAKLEPNLFEKINNFNSLKYLYLKGFIFDGIFTIKLSNLKILTWEKCKKINISDKYCNKLEKLYIRNNRNLKILENSNLKELKKLNLIYNFKTNRKVLETAKFKKLKILNLEHNKIANAIF